MAKKKAREKTDTVQRFELNVLLVIVGLHARDPESSYGMEIKRTLATHTGRDIGVGMLWTVTTRLESKGLIVARPVPPSPERGGRERRAFKLTAKGTKVLTAELAEIDALRGF